mgnify:CR=1 FL=1
MKIISAILFSIFLISQPAFSAEINAAKKNAIRELLNMSGASKIGEIFTKNTIKQTTAIFKKSQPDLPEKAFEILEQETTKIVNEEMLEKESFYELLYPIYDKYYSIEDIKGLINFYKTPLGKKTIEVLPNLSHESFMAGQKWGQAIGPKIGKKLEERYKEEGIDLK